MQANEIGSGHLAGELLVYAGTEITMPSHLGGLGLKCIPAYEASGSSPGRIPWYPRLIQDTGVGLFSRSARCACIGRTQKKYRSYWTEEKSVAAATVLHMPAGVKPARWVVCLPVRCWHRTSPARHIRIPFISIEDRSHG